MIAGLRGEHSVAELCRKEGTNQNLYYRSSRGFLEAGKKRLASDTARETCSGGGPAQHARVDPTRNKLTVVQIAEKRPFISDHLTAQNGRNRPAFDFPSFPWTVIAYVEVSQHAEIARVWGFIRLCRLSRDLLTVGNVGLEHSNGARDQQYDDTQRNENLHHSE